MLVIFLFAVTEYPWEQLHGARGSFGLQFRGIQLAHGAGESVVARTDGAGECSKRTVVSF